MAKNIILGDMETQGAGRSSLLSHAESPHARAITPALQGYRLGSWDSGRGKKDREGHSGSLQSGIIGRTYLMFCFRS